MKKKSVYNPHFDKKKLDFNEEGVLGRDINFETLAESKIFDLSKPQVDFEKMAYLANFKTVNILDESNQERTALMLIMYD